MTPVTWTLLGDRLADIVRPDTSQRGLTPAQLTVIMQAVDVGRSFCVLRDPAGGFLVKIPPRSGGLASAEPTKIPAGNKLSTTPPCSDN